MFPVIELEKTIVSPACDTTVPHLSSLKLIEYSPLFFEVKEHPSPVIVLSLPWEGLG